MAILALIVAKLEARYKPSKRFEVTLHPIGDKAIEAIASAASGVVRRG